MTESNKEIIKRMKASNKEEIAEHLRSITEHRAKLKELEHRCAMWISDFEEDTEKAELEVIKRLQESAWRISSTRRDSRISFAYLLESASTALAELEEKRPFIPWPKNADAILRQAYPDEY